MQVDKREYAGMVEVHRPATQNVVRDIASALSEMVDVAEDSGHAIDWETFSADAEVIHLKNGLGSTIDSTTRVHLSFVGVGVQ